MKKLTLKMDTYAGTGKCACKYGTINRDVVLAMLGEGTALSVHLPGAGHHSTVTTWVIDCPVTAGFIRRLCRDEALRSRAFEQRKRLNQLSLDKKWPVTWAKAIIQIGLNSH